MHPKCFSISRLVFSMTDQICVHPCTMALSVSHLNLIQQNSLYPHKAMFLTRQWLHHTALMIEMSAVAQCVKHHRRPDELSEAIHNTDGTLNITWPDRIINMLWCRIALLWPWWTMTTPVGAEKVAGATEVVFHSSSLVRFVETEENSFERPKPVNRWFSSRIISATWTHMGFVWWFTLDMKWMVDECAVPW